LYELLSVLFVFSLLLALVALRASIVDRNIGAYIACPGCFHSSVLQGDLVIFSLTAGALLVAGLIRPHFPGRLLHMAVGTVIVIYIADLLVFRLFSYRLFVTDAALFISERAAVWDQFSSGVGGAWIAVAILLSLVVLLVFLFQMPQARDRSTRLFLAAVLVISLAADAVWDSPPYVADWLTGNVFSANLATTERVRYSPAVEAEFVAMNNVATRRQETNDNPQSGRDVVIVILESWSNWHSKQFGGSFDWTPRLDSISQLGLRFTDFHSIGFTTSNGLVGILGGQKIWSPFLHLLRRTPFHSMWGLDRTLPAAFSSSGYETAFLTTGPLSLYRKGEWMTDLGFRYVEGNEHPSYAEEQKYAFGAASDAALYRRSLQWMSNAEKPYLLVLETVTTHQPYVDPDSGERSLEKAMRFADRAFGEFFKTLETAGFFKRGLLVVVSDHRSMTPVPAEELERFGAGTFSRVPAFIIGQEFEPGSVNDRVLGQGDLVPSFEWWLSGSALLDPHDAVMFDSTNRTKCAFHARGDRRGLLEVICPEGYGQIRLDGDRTRFVQNQGLEEGRMQSILYTVTKERLSALRRHRQTESNQ
jgi:hypothetical protein